MPLRERGPVWVVSAATFGTRFLSSSALIVSSLSEIDVNLNFRATG
jgi:hypothetical protein